MFEVVCLTEKSVISDVDGLFGQLGPCIPNDNGTCNPEWPCNPDVCNPGP